jgi:hypothetical protein
VLFFIQVFNLNFFYFFLYKKLENKNLFSCGLNNYNQKGIYDVPEILNLATKINFLNNINFLKMYLQDIQVHLSK